LRVVVLTASLGAGHDNPARQIAHGLRLAGHHPDVVDLVDLVPAGVGLLIRAAFRALLCRAPRWWGPMYDVLDARAVPPAPVRAITALLTDPVYRLLSGGADAVVSTFPLGGQVVAAVRARGLAVPLITYLTDPAVHRLWVSEATDLYLATWAATGAEIRRHGPAAVSVVEPAVRPEFRPVADSAEQARCRRDLGLPDGPLAVVMSGSWGVGDLAGAAMDLRDHTPVTPVVVCGRNTGLRRRLAGTPGLVVLGWVPDVARLLRACDIAVLNSGGLSQAEAVASGVPVIHYRSLPGQGEANALVSARAGLARNPRNVDELVDAVADALLRRPSRVRLPMPSAGLIDEIVAMAAHDERQLATRGTAQ
jgi:UDP-N-acetylglucosamine:LPS N-acetylglucosamine transferase